MENKSGADKSAMLASKQYLSQAVGRQIYLTRRRQGLTGSELAEILGVSQQQVSRYERGVCRVDVDALVYLLNQLNVPLDVFFHEVSLILKELSPETYTQYHSLFFPVVNATREQYVLMKADHYFN
ncbi:helix-turn-helix domain-containing protein [Providencia manganoxydans]|uniref:helix-turn-helix domain-containing protein n=1 Tax=Providencia manganoxydans TaxID=2923283 RepID=UPI0034E4FE2F